MKKVINIGVVKVERKGGFWMILKSILENMV